jgi:hypothetical protein
MKLNRTIIALVFCVCLYTHSTNALAAKPENNKSVAEKTATERGLVGHWKLQGDAKDSSGNGNHATNHNVNLTTSEFNGRDSYLEVPNSKSLQFGKGDFAISAWVNTKQELTDVLGDIATKFDPATRKGFNFTISTSNSGYNSVCNDRHLFFGIDSGTEGKWIDCGHPNEKSNISDSLTVFNGELYAGTCDGPAETDWAHVYKYKGGKEWEDCGRLGDGKIRGVLAMLVHNGELYAATTNAHPSSPEEQATYDKGRVYKYLGGTKWEEIGKPGNCHRINAMASFRGKLYVSGGINRKNPGFVYEYQGDKKWRSTGEFNGLPHTLTVHNDRLYAAYPLGEVYSFDGDKWTSLGNPLGNEKDCSQLHAMGVYQGELYVGSWPLGKMSVWRDGKWIDLGRLGDSTEIVGVTTYNGSLYIGTIPRAEVFRFDGKERWTSVGRLFNPPGFEPVPVGTKNDPQGVIDWSRASSIAVFDGKLFSSTATCYRTKLEKPLPNEIRGKVFSYSTGAAAEFDKDFGAGWQHVVAARDAGKLKIYLNGKQVAASDAGDFDVSNDQPLKIGFGPQSHFFGNMRDVRVYNRALSGDELQTLSDKKNAGI